MVVSFPWLSDILLSFMHFSLRRLSPGYYFSPVQDICCFHWLAAFFPLLNAFPILLPAIPLLPEAECFRLLTASLND